MSGIIQASCYMYILYVPLCSTIPGMSHHDASCLTLSHNLHMCSYVPHVPQFLVCPTIFHNVPQSPGILICPVCLIVLCNHWYAPPCYIMSHCVLQSMYVLACPICPKILICSTRSSNPHMSQMESIQDLRSLMEHPRGLQDIVGHTRDFRTGGTYQHIWGLRDIVGHDGTWWDIPKIAGHNGTKGHIRMP